MAYCTNCGATIPSGATYCPVCGVSVNGGQQSQINQRSVANAGTGAPIQQRNIVLCVILSLVTCGIYGLVWFFNIVSDLNAAAPASDDQTPGIVLLLTIVTCGIYGLIWLYRAGEKVDQIRANNGEAPSSSNILYLVLGIFGLGIIAYCLIQTELNKIAVA